MNGISPYTLLIASSIIIIISYLFNGLARKTKIPSVLLLLVLGIVIKQSVNVADIDGLNLFPLLEILGIVGLIMIVLEASLDLDLSKDKIGLIVKAFSISLISLLLSSFTFAAIFMGLLHTDLLNSLIYAIPLSIMSSAIVIPSVVNIAEDKAEFMIYESTISDILGIMFFYLLIQTAEATGAGEVTLAVLANIGLTLVFSFVASYTLIYIFHKIESEIRLFLLIAILILLYSVGKLFHLSSLLIILVFGLILNNRWFFFRGRFKNYINDHAVKEVHHQLKLVTVESSFVVRTFFFVIFGMTIALKSLVNLKVVFISILILFFMYGIRWMVLKVFLKKNFMLELLINPRGLITILLFFNIPQEYQVAEFDSGILLFIIIGTSLLMAYGMIKYGDEKKIVPEPVIEPEEMADNATEIKEN